MARVPAVFDMPICYCEANGCATKYFFDKGGKQKKGQELGVNEFADHQMLERATAHRRETERASVESERHVSEDMAQQAQQTSRTLQSRRSRAQGAEASEMLPLGHETISQLKRELESRSKRTLGGYGLVFAYHP